MPQNGKIHVGYKDLMENYQIVVSNLAAERGEKDTNLVLNLFQSLLDEFTRGHTKNDFEPPKVGATTPGEGGSRRQDIAGVGVSPGDPTQSWPLCSLTAEQSSEEEAEAGACCEYVCSHVHAHGCARVCVCACARGRACVFLPGPKGPRS